MAGSKPKINDTDRDRFTEDWELGIPVDEMVAMWAVSRATVSATARRFGLKPRRKPRTIPLPPVRPRDKVQAGRGHWEFDPKRRIQVWVGNT